MPPWHRPDHVRANLPAGLLLPARFDAFVQAGPPFRIEWNNLDSYSLKPSATREAVPFLRLSDGALVALWYCDESPAVVLIGGHGELKVIARGFDDFLKAAAARCSDVPDIDNMDEVMRVPGVEGLPNTQGLAELQERFDRWFKEHTSLLPPLRTLEAEILRQQVFGIAESMIRDGRSKVYKPSVLSSNASPSWWSMGFRLKRDGTKIKLEYLDYGAWYPVPKAYGLVPVAASLLALVPDKERDVYELAVISAGIVSIDRDRQLLLVPPEMNLNETPS